MSYGGSSMRGGELLGDVQVDHRLFPLGDDAPGEQVTIERRQMARAVPDTPAGVDSDNPIIIRVNSSSSDAINLAESYFTFRARLSRQDSYATGGADAATAAVVAAGDQIAPTIMGPHSLFENVVIRLNGEAVGDSISSGLAPYAAYFKTLITERESTSKSSWLSDFELFVVENPDLGDVGTNTGATATAPFAAIRATYVAAFGGAADADARIVAVNTALAAALNANYIGNGAESTAAFHRRRRWNGVALADGWLQLGMRLKDGVMNQPFYLPPGVTLEFELTPSKKSFAVIGTGTAVAAGTSGTSPALRILPSSFEFNYQQCTPAEDSLTTLKALRNSRPLRYNTVHTRIVSLPGSGESGTLQSILNGVMPDLLVFAAVPSVNMMNRTGAVCATDPFASILLTDEAGRAGGLRVTAGGIQFPQRKAIQSNLEAYAAYVENHAACGDLFAPAGHKPVLSYNQWLQRPIYCVNLREDGMPVWHSRTDDLRRGSLSFDYNLPAGITTTGFTFVMMAVTNASFEIDPSGNVTTLGY